MVKELLLEYKQLLKERRKALLELDGYKLEFILQKELQLLKDLEDELKGCSNLTPELHSLAEEVYSLHEEVAKLTFNMIEALSEGANDEHLFNVQHR
jgi:chromosome segregation ATPase